MPARTMRDDDSGIEDLPMRLLIIGVVMAITIPIIFAGLDQYREQETENQLRADLERVTDLAVQVYTMGAGTAQSITIDVPDETNTVCIGDALLGKYGSTIVYQARGAQRRIIQVRSGLQSIPLCSDSNAVLELGSGRHTLLITKQTWDTDTDALADIWESLNGLDPADHTDGDGDRDNDGYSNREEFVAGTDPSDRTSTPPSRPTDSDNDGLPDALDPQPYPAYLKVELVER